MSWIDPPTNEFSNAPLYADLDLIIRTPNKSILYSNECLQVNERVHIQNAKRGEYEISIVCFQMMKPKKIRFAVAATGCFLRSGLLDFTARKRKQKQCDDLKTGHGCEISIIDSFSGSYSLQSREYQYFSIQFPELAIGQFLELIIEMDSMKQDILHFELSANQIAKFGGTLLKWESPHKAKTVFKIDNNSIPVSVNRLYFSIFGASQRKRKFTLRSSIQVNNKIPNYIIPMTVPRMTPRETLPGQVPRSTPGSKQSLYHEKAIVAIFTVAVVVGGYFVWFKTRKNNGLYELTISDDANLMNVPMVESLQELNMKAIGDNWESSIVHAEPSST
jgi:hypothetical protein